MKKLLFLIILPLVVFNLVSCEEKPVDPPKTNPNVLNIEVVPTFNGNPTSIGNFMGATAAGDTLKLSIWKLLLSGFKMNYTAGGDLKMPAQFAYLSAEENRLKFSLTGITEGSYNGMDFFIGLDSITNHADPALLDGDHPLNPAVNGLHWGWAGGYIFMMLEGEYKNGKKGTYSFHMATDALVKPIHVNIPSFSFEKVNTTKTLVLELKLDEVFKNPANYSMLVDGSSSHSGTIDMTPMGKMFSNLGDIFSYKELK